jgi:hypothetical protein
VQQRRTLKREAFKEMVAQGDPVDTSRHRERPCGAVGPDRTQSTPLKLRAPTSSAHCIITPISIETGPTYLCES